MLISVIIPVYNTREYLAYCINSVLKQTFSDYEIILIDDGSTDGSDIICDDFAKKHKNITVIHKQNSGASSARNAGIKKATGKYIHFIDSDDFLPYNDVYSKITDALSCDTDIVFSRRIRYNEELTECTAIQPEYKRKGLFVGDVIYDVINESYELTLTCPVNKLFRTDFLQKNNLFFTEGLLHEEDEWLPRVIASTDRVWFDDSIIYGVRQRNTGSFSATYDDYSLCNRIKSKMYTVTSGVDFMKKHIDNPNTFSTAVSYYWGYMVNTVTCIYDIKDKSLRRKSTNEIIKNKDFFDNYKVLSNKNWRIMGWMFTHLGVRFTVKIVAFRYKK